MTEVEGAGFLHTLFLGNDEKTGMSIDIKQDWYRILSRSPARARTLPPISSPRAPHPACVSEAHHSRAPSGADASRSESTGEPGPNRNIRMSQAAGEISSGSAPAYSGQNTQPRSSRGESAKA